MGLHGLFTGIAFPFLLLPPEYECRGYYSDSSVVLRLVLIKQARMSMGFIWLRTGEIDGLFWTQFP
jgi:hypothetical protein